jgi:hypothetical protein
VGAFDHCKPGKNPLLSQVNSFGKMPLLANPFPVNTSCLAIVVGKGVVELVLLFILVLLEQLKILTKTKNVIKIDFIGASILIFGQISINKV